MFKKLWNLLLQKGFRIGYSTGRPFDPRNQKRTDAIRDMVERNIKRKRGKNANKSGEN